MALADVPTEYFDEPFETWTGKLPALVLASTRTVPVSTHGQWRLASASCGGHREDIFLAAVLLLDICQEIFLFCAGQRGDTGEIVLTHDPIYNAAMFFLQHRQ
ncbi:hypothetical protein [Citrobacter freundii]|uniref:hypothetical protein n=1 Tax=Citrobacter freundii TaxID=546 RepID=UPI001EF01BC1|nr:hypothetical protein [Citrobacter freundii]